MSDFDPNDRGEYPLGSEPSPNPRAAHSPSSWPKVWTSLSADMPPLQEAREPEGAPIPYARLPTQRPVAPPPELSSAAQFVVGAVGSLVYALAVYSASAELVAIRLPGAIGSVIALSLVVFAVLVGYVVEVWQWRNCLAGVLVVLLGFPLVFVATCGFGTIKLDMR